MPDASIATESPPAANPSATLRAIARFARDHIELDLPIERIPEVLADPKSTLWLDIQLPNGDTANLEPLLRNVFRLDPLAIEDALRETNTPKLDEWDHYLCIVFHALRFNPEQYDLHLIELDLFLGKNFLVSCHAEPITAVDRLTRLLTRDPERQLAHGADHLLYHLLDMIVAEHLAAIEHLDETIDSLEDQILSRPNPQTLHTILRVKQAALKLSRSIGPQREVANRLVRDSFPQIDTKDRIYFRNVYDQLVRLHDITETVRDLVSGALDTYLSVVSNRTNDVMKTLTLVSVLFLPLNFLVGFFGMNFFGDNIHLDGIQWPHDAMFAACLLAMAAAPGLLWLWGKRRGWF
jgi:magnesium transporter